MASSSVSVFFSDASRIRNSGLLDFLPAEDLVNCTQVNRVWHKSIEQNDAHQSGVEERATQNSWSFSSFSDPVFSAPVSFGSLVGSSHRPLVDRVLDETLIVLKILDFLSLRDLPRLQRVNRQFERSAKKMQREKIFSSLSLPSIASCLRGFLRASNEKSVSTLTEPQLQAQTLPPSSSVSKALENTNLRCTILQFLLPSAQYCCKGVSNSFLQDVESVQQRTVLRELSPELVKRHGRERFKDARVIDARLLGGRRTQLMLWELMSEGVTAITFQRKGFQVTIRGEVLPSKKDSLSVCLFKLKSMEIEDRTDEALFNPFKHITFGGTLFENTF